MFLCVYLSVCVFVCVYVTACASVSLGRAGQIRAGLGFGSRRPVAYLPHHTLPPPPPATWRHTRRPLFNPQSHSSRRRAAQQQRQRQRQGQGQGQSTTATATAAASGSASAPTALLAGLTLEGPLSGPAAGEATDGEVGIEAETEVEAEMASQLQVQLVPRRPLRFPSQPAPGPGASQEQQGPQPVEVEVEGQGRQQVSCGWLFSAEDVFERERLTAVLAAAWPRAARLKGIFRWGRGDGRAAGTARND